MSVDEVAVIVLGAGHELMNLGCARTVETSEADSFSEVSHPLKLPRALTHLGLRGSFHLPKRFPKHKVAGQVVRVDKLLLKRIELVRGTCETRAVPKL